MQLRVVVVVLGLLLTSACGNGPAADDPKVLGRTFDRPSVSGMVRRDGAAVRGARVQLGSPARVTVTDDSGTYRFEAVDPGSYRLTVLDGGDDGLRCQPDGACITAQSARHAAVEVVVSSEAVVADVDL